MRYRKLGYTNIDVSIICLGTMTWGEQNSESEAHQQLDYALDQGVNFIDTAELYPIPPKEDTYGRTEEYIGSWVQQRKNRDKFILATKIAGKEPGLSWIRGGKSFYNRQNLEKALHNSLKRLRTDYIDLYQLHWPNRNTRYADQAFGDRGIERDDVPVEETLEVLNDFIKAGKIRFYGLSKETPWGMMNYIMQAEKRGFPRPVTIQNPFSLLRRSFEDANAEVALREGVGLMAYSPLGFGVLSGKYLRGQKPAGSRMEVFGEHFKKYSSNAATSATNEYIKLAVKAGLKPAQMALAFLHTRPFLLCTIVGATKMEHLSENVQSADIQLSEEILEGIEEIHRKKPNPSE
ncbi:aldo/keto reductase [Fibrobacterota bacterium]